MWYYKLKKTANKKRGGEGGAIFSIERPTLLSELEINLLLTIGSSTVLLNTILTGYLSRFTSVSYVEQVANNNSKKKVKNY